MRETVELLMLPGKWCLLLAVFVGLPVQAASFDCGKAANLLEQTVCSDPKLSDYDLLISREFTAALAPLSREGRDELRRGQRSWLHYVQAVCNVDADTLTALQPLEQRTLECLRGQYQQRQDQLQYAAVRAGSYIIRQVDAFPVRATSAGDDAVQAGLHPGIFSSSISWPQIDRPRDASQKAFNSKVLNWVKSASAAGLPGAVVSDVAISYQVRYANSHLLSVLLGKTASAQGAAGVGVINWLFRQKRELQTDDVFDQKKHWRPALKNMVEQALGEYDKTCRCLELKANKSDAAISGCLTAASWLIEKEGLAVQFAPGELGGSVAGVPGVVIPWRKLKPYLAAEPVIALPPK